MGIISDFKRQLWAVILLVFSDLSVTGAWSQTTAPRPATQPCTLMIATDKTIYKVGDPVKIVATTSCISDHGAIISLPRSQLNFTVTCNGVAVDTTEFGDMALGTPAGSGIYAPTTFLAKGQSKSEQFPLSRAFDFSMPGKYQVVALRSVIDRAETSILHSLQSNQTTFEIKE